MWALVSTREILRQIGARGYAVGMQRGEGAVEMRAVKLDDPDQRHIARSTDGDGEADAYRVAQMLAQMVGMEVNEGGTAGQT